MIHLLASANHAYAERIRGWLDHATAHAGEHITVGLCCVVGRDEPLDWVERLEQDYPNAAMMVIAREQLSFQPPLDHLQAGGFLPLKRGIADTDLIIFTDGDALLQRPFTDEEMTKLKEWPARTVGLSYNAGPDDTLGAEATRLGTAHLPQDEKEAARKRVLTDALARGFDLDLPVYNLGVIVCRAKDYQLWHAAYINQLPCLQGLFTHHAHQQWGLCAALKGAGLKVEVLPYSFHLHGHYPTPEGTGREKGRITYGGQPVAFRHHL